MTANRIENDGADRREQRARTIATMGLVNRVRDRFLVSTPSLLGKQISHIVRRDEQGNIVCDCQEYEQRNRGSSVFRCEHILAVKFALIQKTSEPATKHKPARESGSAQRSSKFIRLKMKETSEAGSESGQDDGLKIGDNFMNRSNIIDQMEFLSSTDETFEAVEDAGAPDGRNNVVQMSFNDTHEDSACYLRKTRGGNVNDLDSIEWHVVANILDNRAPNWSHTVRDIRQIGSKLFVTAAINIDGSTREGLGTGDAESEASIRQAEHNALKSAAAKFDVIRELRKGEFRVIDHAPSMTAIQNDDKRFPANPVAASLIDLVTARQLGMIRAVSRELGLDPNLECQRVMTCMTDELSKNAAAAFIGHLNDLHRQTENSIRQPLRKVG